MVLNVFLRFDQHKMHSVLKTQNTFYCKANNSEDNRAVILQLHLVWRTSLLTLYKYRLKSLGIRLWKIAQDQSYQTETVCEYQCLILKRSEQQLSHVYSVTHMEFEILRKGHIAFNNGFHKAILPWMQDLWKDPHTWAPIAAPLNLPWTYSD